MNQKKISEIKEELKKCLIENIDEFIKEYSLDERSGVVNIVSSAKKKKDKYEEELDRLVEMEKYENEVINNGYNIIAGVDEVGRGPLAGPVVTAAVILPNDLKIMYINDSKKLSEKKREEIYDIIMEKAIAVSIGMVDNHVIDDINILNATHVAMKQAVDNLEVKPEAILVDALEIKDVDTYQVGIIKGDAKSKSIAAASIIAKVTRDRMMKEMDKKYPGYDFASNKGYGAAKHIEGLKRLGATEIHRKSFISNII
ncbi:MAG: ribonuclease HII [Clostridia bacterium]|jgi:ribonuclease HII|nr:ribonuclease HII [Clostridia bacterium]